MEYLFHVVRLSDNSIVVKSHHFLCRGILEEVESGLTQYSYYRHSHFLTVISAVH